MTPWSWILLSTALLVGTVVVALGIGRYPVSAAEIVQFALASVELIDMPQQRYTLLHNLILDIRFPRVAAAVMAGAALAVSGATFQAVFRNPLVSPGLLGVLAGAAFGAAAGILISGNWIIIQALSFLMGIAAVGMGLSIANLFGTASIIMLVLGGILSAALFSSLLAIIKYLADPYSDLPTITYWLMGSLGMARGEQIVWIAVPVLLGIALLAASGRALDALSMGDDEARTLGVPVSFVRYAAIAAATLVSALTVSLAGMIGWVGLIVPHIARLLVGPGNATLLPVSALLGATFLLAADICARAFTSVEIPIGIITELLGVPIFVLVLYRVRRGWV